MSIGKDFEGIVVDFVTGSPDNNMEGESIWDMPIVGFSRGDDPCYTFFKQDIGEFFLTPLELFRSHYPQTTAGEEQLTVLSWILPQTKPTKVENASMKDYPGRRWAYTRLYGEKLNRQLAAHVVAKLHESGYEALAPMLSPSFEMKTSTRYGYASSWSERHAAYAAGLGTFGLCDGLITPVGKAMRCGSVIVRARVEPTRPKLESHNPYCKTCGACIARCPVGAITPEGHNKALCRQYLHDVTANYVKDHYGLDIYGCGLCQTGVPCADGIPE
jgi:ferredoxin